MRVPRWMLLLSLPAWMASDARSGRPEDSPNLFVAAATDRRVALAGLTFRGAPIELALLGSLVEEE